MPSKECMWMKVTMTAKNDDCSSEWSSMTNGESGILPRQSLLDLVWI